MGLKQRKPDLKMKEKSIKRRVEIACEQVSVMITHKIGIVLRNHVEIAL